MPVTSRTPELHTVTSPPSSLHETLSLVADTNNVSVARRFVRSALAWCGTPDVVNDLELVSSELVTNAIEHGSGRAVDVIVRYDGTAVVSLSVTSRGNPDKVDPTDEWQIAGADSITGRGLGIVRMLVDNVDVHRNDQELTITVERRVTA